MSVQQVDGNPTAKVANGALAGAAVTLIISVASSFGVVMEPEVAGALVVLFTYVSSYFTKSRPSDIDR